jgi:hypothetical protein
MRFGFKNKKFNTAKKFNNNDEYLFNHTDEVNVTDSIVSTVEQVNLPNNLLNTMTIDTSKELTSNDIDTLLFMYQEEKLARDVYTNFEEQYSLRIFENISNAEQQHINTIEDILIAHEIDIQELQDMEVGEFLNEDLQNLYDDLIEQGSVSVQEALNCGVVIEEVDIADLNEYLSNEDLNENLEVVYSNLENGSQNHLSAFNAVLDNGFFM